MSVKGWLVEKAAGTRLSKFYLAARNLLAGKKTYVVGAIMLLQGLAAFIDSIQGTTIRDILEVVRDPSIETMTKGLELLNDPGAHRAAEGAGIMTLRAGIAKAGERPRPFDPQV